MSNVHAIGQPCRPNMAGWCSVSASRRRHQTSRDDGHYLHIARAHAADSGDARHRPAWHYGSVIAAGIFGIIAAPFISRLSPLFPPVRRLLSTRVLSSVIGPAENATPLHFRLGSRRRRLSGLGLRRWRRQIVALHRIDKFAFRGLANRRADSDTPGRALRRLRKRAP